MNFKNKIGKEKQVILVDLDVAGFQWIGFQ